MVLTYIGGHGGPPFNPRIDYELARNIESKKSRRKFKNRCVKIRVDS